MACTQRAKSSAKACQEFYSMFSIGEGLAGGKHVGKTADQSAKAGEKVDSKVK